MINNQAVSVVIPVYNEEKDIENCLSSLKKQTYQPLEIIVVDDGSTDRSRKVIKKFKAVKLFTQSHLGPGAARNKGARKARGKILVFVDADMTFTKSFIRDLVKPILAGQAIGTFSINEKLSNPENNWAANWSLYRGFLPGRMHPQNHPQKQKVFRAIRKQEFLKVGGFDNKCGYTDDWSLARKLGTEAEAVSGAYFYHKNPVSLAESFKQAAWMAMRPYKLGIIGQLLALIRVSLPFSLFFGLFKAVKYRSISFLFFQLVIDLAQFIGISKMFYRLPRVK